MEMEDFSSDEIDPSTGLSNTYKYSQYIIKKNNYLNNEARRRPFLDLLLIEAKKGADLSDTQIRNEVDTFMVAVRVNSIN